MPDPWTAAARDLVRTSPRAIAHLRRQHDSGRLALVFGAGASGPLGFPTWDELVVRIANHPEVAGATVLDGLAGKHSTLQTEVLFHHFRNTTGISLPSGIADNIEFKERYIESHWIRIIHECLYSGVPSDAADLHSSDMIYKHFLDVIREAPITVTYNFDDSIERLLLHTRTADAADRARGYETVIEASLPFRSAKGVIYHPNGFLPFNILERLGSGGIVLNERHFADQLITSMSGGYSTYLHHLTKSTMVFLGISLADETLRHLLRLNARLNPGHVHYLIHYTPDLTVPDAGTRESIQHANFETFNLVTLFLDEQGIAALGRMLSTPFSGVRNLAAEEGQCVSYTYYLTGVPGSGKTTTFQHLSSLVAYDEWLDERLPLLKKAWTELTDDEKSEVDSWISNQVADKNQVLLDDDREIGVGIRIIDRCPLDAFAFTPADEWRSKAEALLNSISPGHSNNRLKTGHVVLLVGNARELRIRAAIRDRQSGATDAYMTNLQAATKHVYDSAVLDYVSEFDCQGMSREAVVRAVAKLVFLGPYVDGDLHQRLEEAADGSFAAPGGGPAIVT